MDPDLPRKSESMSMDVDDDAESFWYSHYDVVNADSPGSSARRMLSNLPLPGYSFSRPPASDSSPFMMRSSSSTVNDIGSTWEIYQYYGLVRQHTEILPRSESSVSETTRRKRKHTDDDVFTDSAHPQSYRKIRPRLQSPQNRVFSPLLIMSPERERASSVEEETFSVQYPTNMADPSRSIRRYFHPENENHREQEQGLHMLHTSTSSEDLKEQERRRSDSFAEVALASTSTLPQKLGRLSTLQDFWLPCPFEESERSSLGIAVQERGLEAGPSTKRSRLGPAGSPRLVIPVLEPNTTKFFDRPICDSPDSIDPEEDGLRRHEPPAIQVTHVELDSLGSIRSSCGKR